MSNSPGTRLRSRALLKPDKAAAAPESRLAQVEAIFAADPSVSLPDNLFLLQEDLYGRRRRLTKSEAASD
jgi:hypothetical protein